ncbi:MAG: hypothetical protein IJ916_03810 [Paludibacteraceae bacterium]|nr:hypothetical protein [Paludibacteraceae bacterium]
MKYLRYFYLLSLMCLFTACEEDIEIITGEAYDIGDYSAQVTCKYIWDEVPDRSAEYGVCYSISKYDVENGAGRYERSVKIKDNMFTTTITYDSDIESTGSKYYYRGYMYYRGHYYYGKILWFRSGANQRR